MGITYGDYLIDSGYRELTPEQEDAPQSCDICGEPRDGRDHSKCDELPAPGFLTETPTTDDRTDGKHEGTPS